MTMIMSGFPSMAAICYVLSTVLYCVYLYKQEDVLQKTGFALTVSGFAVHSVAVLGDFLHLGYLPLINLRNTLGIAAWSIALVFILFRVRLKIKVMGIYAAPLVTLVYIASLNLPEIPSDTSVIFKSIWLVIHVILAFIGEAALAMACGAGVLYLIQEHAIKSKKRGFFYSRLPSLEQLDAAGYTSIVVGFTMFTIGLIVGLVYAKMVWHRFADWDPKEIWSGISWLVYAALVHERIAVGWRGRRAAILAVAAFALLLFSFLGVNFLLGGHHGGFTQWKMG
jgi:cytochrome c-type biogenesis protein CcsB